MGLAFSIVLVLAVAHIILAPGSTRCLPRLPPSVITRCCKPASWSWRCPLLPSACWASEYYQAIGKPWYSVLLTLMRHVFISVPVVYLLAFVLEMNIIGVYFGAMSGTFVSALLAWRLLRDAPRLLRWNRESVSAQQHDMEVAP